MYFIGGSHDLQKMWLDKNLHYVEIPMFKAAASVAATREAVSFNWDGRATEMVCTVERYRRTARLRTRDAYIYELIDE